MLGTPEDDKKGERDTGMGRGKGGKRSGGEEREERQRRKRTDYYLL